MTPALPFNQDYFARDIHHGTRTPDNWTEPDHQIFKKMKSSLKVEDLSDREPIRCRPREDSRTSIDAVSYSSESPDPELEKLWRDIDKYCDSDEAQNNLCPTDNNSGNPLIGVRRNMDRESGTRGGTHCGRFGKERSHSSVRVHRPMDTNHSQGSRNRRVGFKFKESSRSYIPVGKRSRRGFNGDTHFGKERSRLNRGRTFEYPPSRRDFRWTRNPISSHTSVSDRSREATKRSCNSWEGLEHRSCTETRIADVNPRSKEEMQSGFTCKAQKRAIGNREDRERVMKTLSLFRAICHELRQEDERKKRIEYEAARVVKGTLNYVDYGKHIGAIPGVEVGDAFFNRMEVAIVGLHKLPEAGIDFTKDGSDNVCTSIVAMGSGEYANDMSTWESLIYSGYGGNVGRARKDPEDQRLEGGNLALKNSISVGNPVRVIRANKESGLKGEVERIYIYDGLYTVERYWHDRAVHGKLVFKFELRRNPGQPRLSNSHWKKLGAR